MKKNRSKISSKFLSQLSKDLDFIEENYFFAERKLDKTKYHEVDKQTKLIEKYHIYSSKIISKCRDFMIVKAREKRTGTRRIAKIYSRDAYWKNLESLKLEGMILKNLKGSQSILKLIEILEHGKKVVLIYENAIPVKFLRKSQSNLEAKLMCISALIGICEVNSFGYSLIDFNIGNIFQTETGDYKIGSLSHLTRIGGEISKGVLTSETSKYICPFVKESLNVNKSGDSYSFGIFLSEIITTENQTRPATSREKEKTCKENGLNEILIWTTKKSLRTRMKPYEILSDSYFKSLIHDYPNINSKITSSYKTGREFKPVKDTSSVGNLNSLKIQSDSEEVSHIKNSGKNSDCSTSPTKNEVPSPMEKRVSKKKRVRRNKTELYTRPVYSNFLIGRKKEKFKTLDSKRLQSQLRFEGTNQQRRSKNEANSNTMNRFHERSSREKSRRGKVSKGLKSDQSLNSSRKTGGFWNNLFTILGCSPQEERLDMLN